MAKTIHSGNLTFIDLTDSKKVDVHISSNLPTVQIYNVNSTPAICSPDWTSTPLKLTLTAYADSTDITDSLTNDDIVWYRQIGSGDYVEVQKGGAELQISSNELTDEAIGRSAGVISYICQIAYNNKTFENKATFARTDTGRDGTSVNILGKYNTLDELQAAHPIGNAGDAYVINGHLYAWTADDLMWEDVGNIQGPKGEDAKGIVITGTSQVFKVGASTTTPTIIAVTAKTINFTDDVVWSYRTNNDTNFTTTVPDGVTVVDNKNLTIAGKNLDDTVTFITCKATYGEIEDVFTVYKAIDGEKGDAASMAFLTNENVSFSANANGEIPFTSASTFKTYVVAYNGTTKTTPIVGAIGDLPSGVTAIPNKGTAYSNTIPTAGNLTVADLYTSATLATKIDKTKLENGDSFVVGNYLYIYNSTNYNFKCQTIIDPTDNIEKPSIYVVGNQILITFTIANKATLGSNASNYGEITIPVISPVDTSLILSWSKINSGAKGDKGDKGSDSYTVILTNESHVFAGDTSKAIPSSATTQILAYNGTTPQNVTIVTVNGKTAAIIDTDTGIPGLKFKCSALSGQASPIITFTCTDSFVSPNGSIPVVLSVGGVSITKMFTYSIAFKGATGGIGNTGPAGSPATSYWLVSSASAVQKTSTGTVVTIPSTLTFTGKSKTGTGAPVDYACRWVVDVSTNGTSYTNISTSAANETSKAITVLTTYKSIRVRMYMAGGTTYLLDEQIIPVISDGMVDLQLGGRNLILASNVPHSNSEYRVASYNMSEDWELNATYTLTLKGTIEEGKIFGAWANGSGTRVATLSYDASNGVYISTFKTPATIASQTPKVINIYNTPSTTAGSASIEWVKLEKGNKATDWSPAPEDLKSTTFELYAPKGYLITNDVPTITLETFAYDGSQAITNATFVWYSWNGESWVAISEATGTSLTINKSNVFKSNVYKCDMTYDGKVYTATATVEDKTDIYDSLIHVTSKYSPSNRLYWVLYSTVYSEEGEKDELLGPVSVISPTNPTTGTYWYKIDETNYTVTLMKYSGTAWVATTDKQEFVYDWFMLNDTNSIVTLGERSKVKIVTSDNFSRTCSVQCNVLDQELAALTHSNQVINDPSDPIVSETEPTNPINGQLWIKTGANGSYMLLVWDATNNKWVVSEADTQKKVYVQKPTTYNEGDIWIVAAEYEPDAYVDGVLQKETIEGVTKVVKHIAGTMLIAQYASQTYKDSDWIDALKYTKALDKVNKQMDIYNQFFTFDNTGMTMKAKSLNGQISEFSTKLTNTELGFYQGENKVAYINNNQLNISKAEITNGMVIGGTEPMLQIGNFVIMQESNGSLSIGLKS